MSSKKDYTGYSLFQGLDTSTQAACFSVLLLAMHPDIQVQRLTFELFPVCKVYFLDKLPYFI